MTRLHPGRVLLTCAIAALALTACGPTATPAATQPSSTGSPGGVAAGATTPHTGDSWGAAGEACALVTTAEAGAVVGASVNAEEQDQGIIKACRYRPANPIIGSVYVSVLTVTPAEFEQAAANLPVAHADITGIGDKAVFAAEAGELLVLAGSHLVGVIVVHKGPTFGTEAEVRTIASAALSRL